MTPTRQPTPLALQREMRDTYLRYYDTAFRLRDAALMEERRRLVEEDGGIAREPWLEVLPEFVHASQPLEDTCADLGLPELDGLLRAGLMRDAPRPYQHQSDSLLASHRDGRDVVVTAGTGSGKTEAFLLPLLAGLVRESRTWSPPTMAPPAPWWDRRDAPYQSRRVNENRPAGVRALVLYPMNALVEDQLVRLRRSLDSPEVRDWFAEHRPGQRFWFSRYTSQSPVSGPRSKPRERALREELQALQARHRQAMSQPHAPGRWHVPDPEGAEMLARWDVQDAPPDILITNYSMLNVALMRDDEQGIFDATRAWLEDPQKVFTVVVDELHLYRGTSGTEVAHLLQRLLRRLGLHERPEQVRYLATSASLQWDRPEDKRYVEGFFGRPASGFTHLPGSVEEPAPVSLDPGLLRSLRDDDVVLPSADALRGALWHADRAEGAARPMSLLATEVLGEDAVAEDLDELLRRTQHESAVRLRAHLVFRTLGGVWACSDGACSAVTDRTAPAGVGRLYSQPRLLCDCGARVLELLYCDRCGDTFLGGSCSTEGRQVEYHLSSGARDLEALPDRADDRRSAAGYRVVWLSDDAPSVSRWTRLGGLQGHEERPTFTYAWERARLEARTGRVSSSARASGRPCFVLEAAGGTAQQQGEIPALPLTCPSCGHNRDRYSSTAFERRSWDRLPVRTMGIGYERANQVLVDALVRGMPTQVVAFSDSRQDAARVNAGVERSHYLDLVRQSIFEASRPRSPVAAALAFLKGQRTAETQQAFDRFEPGSPAQIALLAALSGSESEEQRRLLDGMASASEMTLLELANLIAPRLLKLGVNPAGIAQDCQETRGRDPQPWTALWQWGEMGPDRELPDVKMSEDLKDLRRRVMGALERQVRETVFAVAGRDVESLGLAHASSALRPVHGSPVSDALLQEVSSSAVRILGTARQFMQGKKGGSTALRKDVRDYLNAVAARHAVDADDLERAVCVALGLSAQNMYRLDAARVVLVPARPGAPLYSCERCGAGHLHASAGICATCRAPLPPTSTPRPEDDYYGYLAQDERGWRRLHCEELSGQTERQEAQRRQARFQGVFLDGSEVPLVDGVDLLSVTTTMEAGVDIGSLRAVAMANVPPQRFNYQQRVGRSGRRGDALSVALTVCRGSRSHDLHYFDDLAALTSGPLPPPFLDVRGTELAERAARAEILREAFLAAADVPGFDPGRNVHGQLGRCEDYASARPRVEAFLRDRGLTLARELFGLLLHGPGAAARPTSEVERLARQCVEELPAVMAETAAAELGSPDLAQRLAERGLLPMFGFPTRLRNLQMARATRRSIREALSRDLDIAISEFAPGNELVKDKSLHTAVGLVAYEVRGQGAVPVPRPEGDVFQGGLCRACSAAFVGQVPPACSVCGADDEEYSVQTVSQPLGFRTSYWPASYEGTQRRAAASTRARLAVEDPPEEALVHNAAVSSGKATLLSLNDNHGRGFRFGAFSVADRSYAHLGDGLISLDVKEGMAAYEAGLGPLRDLSPTRTVCLSLGSRRRTDVLRVRPRDWDASTTLLDPAHLAVRASFISLAYLLRDAAARLLDVGVDELDVGLSPRRLPDGRVLGEVFLADSLQNGAGYATWLGEHVDDLFAASSEAAAGLAAHGAMAEPCDSSCYRCLRDHTNTMWHGLLDWRLGGDLLRLLHGEAPPTALEPRVRERLAEEGRAFGWEVRNSDEVLVWDLPRRRHRRLLVLPALAPQDVVAPGSAADTLREEGHPVMVTTAFEFLRRPGPVEAQARDGVLPLLPQRRR